MKTTKAERFGTYVEVINFINSQKGITNVRMYEDGESVVVTWEIEVKK